ncbi:MAG TPA: M23 family metallopeptidase [Longimicrobiales bacterium]
MSNRTDFPGVSHGMRRFSRYAHPALLIACCAFSLMAPPTSSAQAAPDVRITWAPERPVQGTLFRVRVAADIGEARVEGSIAGEPLHFSKSAAGWEALAAAPLDKGAELGLTIAIASSSGVDSVRAKIPIARGSYTLEKLTVAPRFGTPPDSALQARMDRERERALAVSRASHFTPRLWNEVHKPRDTRITSAFGSGREFNGQIQSRHTGTDFAGAVGTPVRAAARGVVALVDTFYLAGRVIYIDHGEGLVSAYFHLSRQDVAVGDTVAAGQQIGLVGATGRVTGPHLHWVVRYGAISVDPLSFLAIAKP